MRIEKERGDTESEDGYPEINQVSRPERQCHIEQHQQSPHAQVNARASESREKNTE